MINNYEKVLSFIIDMENDEEVNIRLDVEYNTEDEMFYIYHNYVDNNFESQVSRKINEKLVRYLDSQGVINYTFGYSAHLNSSVKENGDFRKDYRKKEFPASKFQVSTSRTGHSKFDLVA